MQAAALKLDDKQIGFLKGKRQNRYTPATHRASLVTFFNLMPHKQTGGVSWSFELIADFAPR
jgi:hypothetical protein